MRKPHILLTLLIAAVLLSGFAASAPPPSFRPTDRLEIVRYFLTDPTLNHMAPGTWTVADAERAGRMEQAILALPPPPDGFRWGAIDYGVRYRLTFFFKGQEILQAVADAGNLLEVHLPEGDDRQADDAFWRLLGQVLNLPVEGGIFLHPSP